MTALGEHGPVAVVGAGPAGALLAVFLAREGHAVDLYEKRSDMRRVEVDAGRSINLALATRGIVPLVDIGVIERVDEITIPMRGRLIHAEDADDLTLQPYGSHPHEVIHSVSRRDLNAILLDAAEERGVAIRFEHDLSVADLDARVLHFDTPAGAVERPFGVVVGADGFFEDAGLRLRRIAEHRAVDLAELLHTKLNDDLRIIAQCLFDGSVEFGAVVGLGDPDGRTQPRRLDDDGIPR